MEEPFKDPSRNIHLQVTPDEPMLAPLYARMVSEVRDYAIFLLDAEGNILSWNAGAREIKGYSPEEIIGRHFRVFYPQDDRDARLPETLLRQAAAEGRVMHEGWRVKKDGSHFWGSVVITAVHDEQGEVVAYSKLTRDLTERRRNEELLQRYAAEVESKNEQLRKSEERYHRMVAEVEDYAIILLDREGHVQNWNRGAEKIKGYRDHEIIGRHFRTFYLENDRIEGLPETLLSRAAAENKATHEGWRLRKDGSRFWGSIVITALHDPHGEIIGFSKVTRDLTQKKKAEDEILRMNKQLEEFAYVASHDLQEPLRKIRVLTSRITQESVDPDVVALYLGKIGLAAERMSNLIAGVLCYSSTATPDGCFEVTDLDAVWHEVLSDFELRLEEQNVRLQADPLPSIEAIPVQMHQLFANLLGNAIKFSPERPEIRLGVTLYHDAAAQRDMVDIAFSDNGIGLDMKYQARIFQLFQRLSLTGEGTGIGLALCKRIVENHQGSIAVESTPGHGATFRVRLPLHQRREA